MTRSGCSARRATAPARRAARRAATKSRSPSCRGTRGRTAVIEAFRMDKDIEATILKTPTELDMSKQLREKGMLTMKEDAMIKAFNKIIPFEEVNKL